MQIVVTYLTKTGHSRKIAKAIGAELGIEALDIKDSPRIGEVDLLFIVGGIYGGQSLPELISFAETLDNNKIKKIALITSCTSKTTKQDAVRAVLVKNRNNVVPEEFICQGSFLFFGLGHPNKTDIANAVAYAKKLAV